MKNALAVAASAVAIVCALPAGAATLVPRPAYKTPEVTVASPYVVVHYTRTGPDHPRFMKDDDHDNVLQPEPGWRDRCPDAAEHGRDRDRWPVEPRQQRLDADGGPGPAPGQRRHPDPGPVEDEALELPSRQGPDRENREGPGNRALFSFHEQWAWHAWPRDRGSPTVVVARRDPRQA